MGDDEATKREFTINTVVNVSAFLAGFSLASIIVMTGDPAKFRWPGWATLFLTIAAVVLIFTAQRSQLVVRRYHHYKIWRHLIFVLYHAGTGILLAGLATALAPKQGIGTEECPRWFASWIAWVACILELAYSAWLVRKLIWKPPEVTRTITYRGNPPWHTALVQFLKEEGVRVEWTTPPTVTEERGIGADVVQVVVNLYSTGTAAAIADAVQRFRNYGPRSKGKVEVKGEPPDEDGSEHDTG